ncbi:GCN5-related N-acetyltransferase 5, chloroplastic-like [Phragmites australis]|uniref:GCN5-related N-acetyltransferase 5, chloroplastic-like n=1 Tax=Phragmites australis TaxID=29695 RepID=UPI002D7778A9|nr:GCN5-related N-acetyltransferase 5, chloroplastic-like [Phragmites australis]XP_062225857.1 GCN5-related N-acetyltransferase 5, chloroplastic-like [Phragmites australis]XP_062225859.1 GCN5-related N-acetyltransferase 5, chloroplastic-like [Phragmites australis]XP_062225860.1 GCN5-related N-acetyltransferase 5, chloroplastic-like [Phragmites australis]
MAASPALLSLTPAVSRHPHLLFSPCPSPRHLRLAPPAAASASPGGGPGGGGGGVFLSPRALSQLDELAAFRYEHSFPHGSLTVRALTPDDDAMAEALVRLLASSFSETVRWAPAQRYAQLLTFVIRRYLHERRGLAPHAAVLVGFYRPADAAATEEDGDGEGEGEAEGGDEGEMACTAEVSFDAVGAPGAPPTPTPPLEFPYICNMTVKTSLRRRGIGKQLLKACEDLVIKMDAKRRIYLHCRIIDQVPFNMYRKAGYNIVQTDSILVWLSLQKRKHLMSKELPQASVGSEITTKDFDDNIMTS